MAEEKDLIQRLRKELKERNLLEEAKFRRLVEESERSHRSIVEILYRSEELREKELGGVLSAVFGYPPVNISTFVIEPEILGLIPKEVARKSRVLPVTRHEGTLTLAIADPTKLEALDDIHALVGLRIKPVLAVPSELEKAIERYYGEKQKGISSSPLESFEEIIAEVRSQTLTKSLIKGTGDLSDLIQEANATPVVRLVNHLLIEAIRRGASDVFVEPWEKTMRVRYRVDGLLEEVLNSPRTYVEAVVSRIKVMSHLNIAERRIPQDGRFKARIFGHEVDLRVSVLPTCFGEKACLRILDTAAQAQQLDRLGFDEKKLQAIHRVALRPHGMILVTGPTGSGKTTTLYGVLQYLNTPEKNITTVEDPVEYQVPGINQVNVREQVGLTFPAALRSILRQDPDIILIGEIRDLATMDIAIKSALTGHLVLSTLHTNDATSAIVRMVNMGIEPFLIASSVLMISAQRLVRKLCPVCRVSYQPDSELLETVGISDRPKPVFYAPKGCSQCRGSGFKGRTVITELFEMKPRILEVIMKGATGEELREVARETGMGTLRDDGLKKVSEGLTALEEVLRVTSPEPQGRGAKAKEE